MPYSVKLIGTEEKDALYARYIPRLLYARKSEIYGCCVKLLTDDDTIVHQWQDNFYMTSENLRSHGRVIVTERPKHGDGRALRPVHQDRLRLQR